MNSRFLVYSGALFVAVAVWGTALAYASAPETDVQQLVELLAFVAPLVCVASLLALMVLAATNLGVLRGLHRLLTPQQWTVLALLLAVVVIARVTMIPAGDRLYFDEQVFVQIARGLRDAQRAGAAVVGRIEAGDYNCEVCSYPKRPLAWPTLIAAFAWPGIPTPWHAQALNLLLSLLAIIGVALLASLLLSKRYAIPAAAVYAVLPANAAWSRAGASDMLASALAVFMLLLTLVAARQSRSGPFWLLAATMVLLANTRNEAIVLLGLPVLALLLCGHKSLRTTTLPATIAVVVATIPLALHLGVQQHGYDPAVADQSGLGLQYLHENLAAIARYLGGEPVLFGALVLSVIATAALMPFRPAVLLVAWTLAAALPALLYVAGSLTLPGGDRFVLSWTAPVAIAASVALVRILELPSDPVRQQILRRTGVAILGLALFWAARHTAILDRTQQSPSADVQFAQTLVRELPLNALVLTTLPAVVLNGGRSAAYLPSVACDRDALEALIDEHRSELYLLRTAAFRSLESRALDDCGRLLDQVARLSPVIEDGPGTGRSLYRIESAAGRRSGSDVVDRGHVHDGPL